MNVILYFHVADDIDWFDKTIALIKSKYNMVSIDTLDQFYQGKVKLKNACHITVDDGHETFYRIMYPVLKKYNVPASIYISPQIFKEEKNYWFQEIEDYDPVIIKQIVSEITGAPLIELEPYAKDSLMKALNVEVINQVLTEYRKRTNTPLGIYQNMTIDELLEIDRGGLVTIGGHTMNHPILNNENDENSAYEITESIAKLAEMLGHNIDCFAYPNGIPGHDFTARELQILKNNNIKLCFSTDPRPFTTKDNIYSIPRVPISNNEGITTLNIKLTAGHFWLKFRNLWQSREGSKRTIIKKLLGANIFCLK